MRRGDHSQLSVCTCLYVPACMVVHYRGLSYIVVNAGRMADYVHVLEYMQLNIGM